MGSNTSVIIAEPAERNVVPNMPGPLLFILSVASCTALFCSFFTNVEILAYPLLRSI